MPLTESHHCGKVVGSSFPMTLTRLARPCLLLLTASMLLLTLTGCGMSEEDRDYYLRGWIRPTDLDKPSPAELHRKQALADGSTSTSPYAPPTDQRQSPAVRDPVPTIDFQ